MLQNMRGNLRVHSHQDRRVRDLPILGEPVTLLIAQKRYFCDNAECEVYIFTKQTDFVGAYFHFTERCREYMLKAIGANPAEASA